MSVAFNPFYQRLELYRGESATFEIIAFDPDAAETDPPTDDPEARIDLTDAVIHFWAKLNRTSAEVAIELDSESLAQIEILDQTEAATKGKARIYLEPIDTDDLETGNYEFEVRAVDDAGAVRTLASGQLILKREVIALP